MLNALSAQGERVMMAVQITLGCPRAARQYYTRHFKMQAFYSYRFLRFRYPVAAIANKLVPSRTSVAGSGTAGFGRTVML
jgi:hypothetical protein